MRAILLLCAVVASCGLPGCGSVFNLGFTPCGTNHDAGKIYGGVRNDFGLMAGGAGGTATRAFGVVDLPLSFAVDTVTLPLVVPIALAKYQKAIAAKEEKGPAKETTRNEPDNPASGVRTAITPAP